jgi:hypothetical protein
LEVEPSVQVTIAVAFAAPFAAAVALASTPPWPEQAPRPVADDVDPSVHTDPFTTWAEAEMVHSAVRAAE